eukprot:283061_1
MELEEDTAVLDIDVDNMICSNDSVYNRRRLSAHLHGAALHQPERLHNAGVCKNRLIRKGDPTRMKWECTPGCTSRTCRILHVKVPTTGDNSKPELPRYARRASRADLDEVMNNSDVEVDESSSMCIPPDTPNFFRHEDQAPGAIGGNLGDPRELLCSRCNVKGVVHANQLCWRCCECIRCGEKKPVCEAGFCDKCYNPVEHGFRLG